MSLLDADLMVLRCPCCRWPLDERMIHPPDRCRMVCETCDTAVAIEPDDVGKIARARLAQRELEQIVVRFGGT